MADGSMFEAEHEQILDETAGMVVAIKSRDDAHGVCGVVGDLIKAQVVGRNHLPAQEVLADVFVPDFPISAAGAVEQDQRHQAALAGLHERQRFVAFVQRSKSAGKQAQWRRSAG